MGFEDQMSRPRAAVLMVGVTRPDVATVLKNIVSNIDYFSTFQSFDTDFFLTTYETEESLELRDRCRDRGLELHLLPHLEEDEFKFRTPYPNTYRMFDSVEKCLQVISDISVYSCIVRLRIDIRIHHLAVLPEPEAGKYYAMPYDDGVVDNIGFCRPDLFARIWSLDRLRDARDELKPERNLAAIINALGVTLENIAFDFALYQSSAETVLGVQQWSRRNRRFRSDGRTVSRDFPPIKPPKPVSTQLRNSLFSAKRWKNRLNRASSVLAGYSSTLIGKLQNKR